MYAEMLYGPTAQLPTAEVTAPTERLNLGSAEHSWASLASPHNPLTWFAAILLITVGAAGVAGSARVGPAHVSASLGQS